MKIKKLVIGLTAFFAFCVLVSCSDEEMNAVPTEENLTLQQKLQLVPQNENYIPYTNQRAPISYISDFCPDPIAGTTTQNSYLNASLWDYYSFEGTVGDVISIQVERTSDFIDPAFSLFFGTTGDSNGVDIMNGGPDMTFLEFRDDEVPNPYGSFCFDDPELADYILPFTGTYTLAVFDFQGCLAPFTYLLTSTGICGGTVPLDSDGDGCNDDVDPHPNSNIDPTVIIDGCNSFVPNVFVTNCSTMSDLIADCAASATDHSEFVSCVSHLTNEWKSQGFLIRNEKGDIMSCAGQSNIP